MTDAPAVVRCGNPDCGERLDEPSNLDSSEREPCPACGSLTRVFEKSLIATIGVIASIARTKIHEELQRHWLWYLLGIALPLAGSVIGYFIGGLLGLLVGIVIGLLGVPVGERGVTRVREIERRGD